MRRKKTNIAICYDFDGTLASGNMQEHSLLPELNLKPQTFWEEVKQFAKKNNTNEVLSYMYLTLKKSREKSHPIRRDSFQKHGKKIKLFKGLDNFFKNINNYAKTKNITIEHYLISSGLKEIIEGNKISKNFKYIFASEFFYDENGVANWPASAIDYTGKTQFLFRINKGIFNVWDNTTINKYIPEEKRHIPFSRLIYIGDGETDIPCMKMVNYQGGYSIAVYDSSRRKRKNIKSPTPKEICRELIVQNRAKYMASADYSENSELFTLLKKIIDKIQAEEFLKKEESKRVWKVNANAKRF